MRISKLSLTVKGEEITDFSKWQDNEEERYSRVPLMNKEDVVETTPSKGFKFTYVPGSGADRDWNGLTGFSAIGQKKNGQKCEYSGCTVLKVTPNELDGKTAAEYVVDVFASEVNRS
ncbi:MAG: hypothetical protein WCS18_05260 [Sphaerochaetaceae bacterium]